jgi:hypothetical protein
VVTIAGRAHLKLQTNYVNPRAIHTDYSGATSSRCACAHLEKLLLNKSLCTTRRSYTKARGCCRTPGNQVPKGSPRKLLKRPISRPDDPLPNDLFSIVDNQISVEQPCEAERMTNSPSSDPARQNEQPTL